MFHCVADESTLRKVLRGKGNQLITEFFVAGILFLRKRFLVECVHDVTSRPMYYEKGAIPMKAVLKAMSGAKQYDRNQS